jgi:anaerobic selenocysteine-containing dehydrogenase
MIAISLLDRPICEADGVADAIRWPVMEPDRDVRGFQSVLLDLGARLGLPGMVNEDGSPATMLITAIISSITSASRALAHWPDSAVNGT